MESCTAILRLHLAERRYELRHLLLINPSSFAILTPFFIFLQAPLFFVLLELLALFHAHTLPLCSLFLADTLPLCSLFLPLSSLCTALICTLVLRLEQGLEHRCQGRLQSSSLALARQIFGTFGATVSRRLLSSSPFAPDCLAFAF